MKRRAESPSANDDEEYEVMSEVHLGCPPGVSGRYISHFTFSNPRNDDHATVDEEILACQLDLDEDGDLLLPRLKHLSKKLSQLTVQHNITSSIPNVGLQVWKAELVLADFVLHKMFTSSDFEQIVSVELGAGTGLVGILLACVAKTVYLTDYDHEILSNCTQNVMLNYDKLQCRASVYVRELNWEHSWPPIPLELSKYSWTSFEAEAVQDASLLLASDVIYSDHLTDAFFTTLEKLMSCGAEKVLYMALEKRCNFTLDDLKVVVNGYSHFRSYFRVEDDVEHHDSRTNTTRFNGKLIDLAQIPQYIKEYERGNDIELWEIKYKKPDML